MRTTRTGNSIRNTFFALGSQAVQSIMAFVCRTVFINTLGKTYLGFNGLFSDILTLLSLAELGVGTAILYSMYKPAAVDDKKTLTALLNLYKKIYNTIGLMITVIGLCITPFLNYLISDIPNMPELSLIYILYLFNTSFSYFFIYKKSILIVYQKSYIYSIVYIVTSIAQSILQILFLFFTKNFIIYLIIQMACTLANNIIVSIYVDKKYSFIKKYKNEMVSQNLKKKIFTNVKAMFVSKLSSAIVTSTDNLLISKFVSTIVLGMYSNYTLFITLMRTIVLKVFEALTGSIGNLVATESSDRIYNTFKKIWFINFWIVGFPSAALFVLINPFIDLWIGSDYLLGIDVVFLVCLNLFMRLIRNTLITFNDSYGHFVELRIKCIAEAIINLIVSLAFVLLLNMGIHGILLGTFISNLTTNFWYEPYLLFEKKFHVGLKSYFFIFGKYLLVIVAGGALSYFLCYNVIFIPGWIGFIIKLILTCLVINFIIVAAFFKTEEFKYLLEIVKSKFKKKSIPTHKT